MFLKPVACAVDAVPVDVSMLVEPVAHVTRVALPLLFLLPFGDVLFAILKKPDASEGLTVATDSILLSAC